MHPYVIHCGFTTGLKLLFCLRLISILPCYKRSCFWMLLYFFFFCSCLFWVVWFWLLCVYQLRSIYSAGNTVPIPFLRATDISPIALLSEDVLGDWQRDNSGKTAVEAMQELFSGDSQSKKGRSRQNEVLFTTFLWKLQFSFISFNLLSFYKPLIDWLQVPLPPSVYQRLTSSPTLMNLAQALAYHKMYVELYLDINLFTFDSLLCPMPLGLSKHGCVSSFSKPVNVQMNW